MKISTESPHAVLDVDSTRPGGPERTASGTVARGQGTAERASAPAGVEGPGTDANALMGKFPYDRDGLPRVNAGRGEPGQDGRDGGERPALLPGASRAAARILANLRAYAADPHASFPSCWQCSPLPSHFIAGPCSLCREDVAAEEARLGMAPPADDTDHCDRSWGDLARDVHEGRG